MAEDLELEKAIIQELENNVTLAGAEITVTVKDGIVTLRGSVDTLVERVAARADAFQAGAVRVRNCLKLRKVQPPSPRR
jgi:osmotically-inducible protein OsmY